MENNNIDWTKINSKLKSVTELPAAEAQRMLDGVVAEEDT